MMLLAARQTPAQVLVQQLRTDLPSISRLAPVGFQRGTTVELQIEGERFEGINDLLAPAGMRLVEVLAVEEKLARVKVEIAADAPLGVFPLHALCKAGLSNPRLVRIDRLPVVVEAQDNNELEHATAAVLPGSVSGSLTAADVDHYRFDAAAGQQVVFDVEAHRLGSPTRPVITLFDAAGRQIAASGSAPADIRPDNRLEHTFASPGTYVVRVHDLTYEGAVFATYYLRMGEIPVATEMFPLGGQRGSTTVVTLSGGNLKADLAHPIDLTGEIAWQRTRIVAELEGQNVPAPMLFAVGEYPELIEQEPNDQPGEAQAVVSPVTVNGRIDQPGDRDTFAFDLAAGGRVTLRVLAQELGSPLDAVITIRDESGSELAAADDREATGREPPVVRSVIAQQPLGDPLLEFAAPSAGRFMVTLEDRCSFGGASYAYRLEMAPSRQDFELLAQPGRAIQAPGAQAAQQQGQQVINEFTGAGTGALSIDRGGTATVVVRAIRSGYNGPIALTVENLPESVQVPEAVIPAGQNDVVMNFNADFEAASSACYITVVGRATEPAAGGQAGSAATGLVRRVEQPLVLASLPINGVVQHEVGQIALGVSQQGAELAVRGTLEKTLVQAGTATVAIAVRRREGFAGDVALRVLNLPAGLSAAPITVPSDSNDARLELVAGLELTPGSHLFLIEGSLAVAGRAEPYVTTFPLVFEVLPLVAMELAAQQVEVSRLAASTLELVIQRHGVLSEPIELSFAGLPKGVRITETMIAPGIDRFALVIEAGEDATASPIRRIVQVKARTRSADRVIDLPTLRFALKVTNP